jgi:hypothetical protein
MVPFLCFVQIVDISVSAWAVVRRNVEATAIQTRRMEGINPAPAKEAREKGQWQITSVSIQKSSGIFASISLRAKRQRMEISSPERPVPCKP